MAASTSRAGRTLWNLENQATRYELRPRQKKSAEEIAAVVADAVFQTMESQASGKERALSFFWKNAWGLERSPPEEARGAVKRKWAFKVRDAAYTLESQMLANSKHRLWKPLRLCKAEAVSRAIVEAVLRNR